MALTKFTEDVEVIQKLSGLPNDDDGLTADELKARFDLAAVLIKAYLNNTLTTEVEAIVAAAASGISPITGLSGLSIVDGSIPNTKLKTTPGQEAVTTDTVRDGAITYLKLGADVKTQIENILNSYASISTRVTNLNTDVVALDTLAHGKQNQHVTAAVELSAGATSWVKTVPGLTNGASVFIAPAPSSNDLASKCKILCTGQTATTLTFTAKSAPTSKVTMNVAILDAAEGE